MASDVVVENSKEFAINMWKNSSFVIVMYMYMYVALQYRCQHPNAHYAAQDALLLEFTYIYLYVRFVMEVGASIGIVGKCALLHAMGVEG